MRLAPITVMLTALFALAACMAENDDRGAGSPDPEDACGASAYQALVGQDAAVLADMTFDGPMRHFPPDTAGTMDYIPERLNISSDARGVITRVYCG